MIGKLKGIVDSVGEEEAVIDVNGVGYLVLAGAKTLARLEADKPVVLHIETYVREDQLKLFGFLSESDRAWFVRLQSVQGVGAKHALSMLDVVSAAEIESAATLGDSSTFERAKGVGKKLAQRISAELKDKAPPLGRSLGAGAGGLNAALGTAPAAGEVMSGAREAAVSALINLGYGESDARRAVAQVSRDLGGEAGEGALIKGALKELAR